MEMAKIGKLLTSFEQVSNKVVVVGKLDSTYPHLPALSQMNQVVWKIDVPLSRAETF